MALSHVFSLLRFVTIDRSLQLAHQLARQGGFTTYDLQNKKASCCQTGYDTWYMCNTPKHSSNISRGSISLTSHLSGTAAIQYTVVVVVACSSTHLHIRHVLLDFTTRTEEALCSITESLFSSSVYDTYQVDSFPCLVGDWSQFCQLVLSRFFQRRSKFKFTKKKCLAFHDPPLLLTIRLFLSLSSWDLPAVLLCHFVGQKTLPSWIKVRAQTQSNPYP